MRKRRNIAILAGLLVLLVAINFVEFRRDSRPAAKETTARAEAAPKRLAITQDPTLRLDLLEKVGKLQYGGTERNIFQFRAPPSANSEEMGPPTPPPPPPIPLKFFGFATTPETAKKIFLANGDEVFVVSEGDVVMKQYRVVRIGVNMVEVEDMTAKRTATLPLEAQ